MTFQGLDITSGVTSDERGSLGKAWDLIQAKASVNKIRSAYYEGRQFTASLGIAVPDWLTGLPARLGWPAKAVDMLEARIQLAGFSTPEGADEKVNQIWGENRLSVESSMVHTTALKYGCAFLAVLPGDPTVGEPEVVIRGFSPLVASVDLDPHTRRAHTGLAIIRTDRSGNPLTVAGFLSDRWVIWSRTLVGESWKTAIAPHDLGVAPIVTLAYKPSMEDRFGRSRITKPVMDITDRAVRTLVREEISAEFYSFPQRWVIGPDPSTYLDSMNRWKQTLATMFGIEAGFNSDVRVGQFPQASMQPHQDMLRMDAALFSGETNIPVSALGIIHENPASDAAMHTAYLALNADAESAHKSFGAAWVEAMQLGWRLANNSQNMSANIVGLRAKWRDPSTPTRAAAADAATKLVSAGILLPDSSVTLDMIGLAPDDQEQLRSDRAATNVDSLGVLADAISRQSS